MSRKLDPDNKRSIRLTIFLSPIEMLRFEKIRRVARPIPTQSTLGHSIVMDWIEHKESLKK